MTGHPCIPVVRPRLPAAEAIRPYLRDMEMAVRQAGERPLRQMLQLRLAALWGLAPHEVALLSSTVDALTLSLVASGARPGRRCLMPAWTFGASARAVVRAGLVPHFVDVCPRTWMPDPALMLALARQHDVGAVLVVAPFGAPVDVAAWDAVQAGAGVPVVIDGAAAFDTVRAGGPMRPGACAVAVSLQASKVFGVGEGGALICRDPVMMDRVRRLARSATPTDREAGWPGGDATLSEQGAAVGLAGLDGWAEARGRWQASARRYLRALPEWLAVSPGFGEGWVTSTLNVLWPRGAGSLATALAAGGVQTRRWWGDGCHVQPACRGYPREALPVTEDLVRRTLGLPFWQDLTPHQVGHVCATLRACSPAAAMAATA